MPCADKKSAASYGGDGRLHDSLQQSEDDAEILNDLDRLRQHGSHLGTYRHMSILDHVVYRLQKQNSGGKRNVTIVDGSHKLFLRPISSELASNIRQQYCTAAAEERQAPYEICSVRVVCLLCGYSSTGRASAFQADGVGSSPTTHSNVERYSSGEETSLLNSQV